ncbi:MAG: hypothetical protein JST68_22675 [Bacteroidetes bacterium]|nr:hypothetical protein [Bacteroidota bacterium]
MGSNTSATTIDEVLLRLSAIIKESQESGDRCGFFATLYHKVTERVKEGIDKGQFEDGKRMEKLDVLFANRYLDALATWKAGGTPTASWKIAFEACQRGSVIILQHLLLGISAHINLDLGIAAAETMAGQELGPIEKDFDNINTILGAMTYEVINEINRLSPLISLIGKHSKNTESVLVQFSMTNARDGAWCFAEDLFKLSGDKYVACIADRDASIAKLGHTLVHFRAMLRLTIWFIYLFECKRPRRIIEVLQERRTFIHVK